MQGGHCTSLTGQQPEFYTRAQNKANPPPGSSTGGRSEARLGGRPAVQRKRRPAQEGLIRRTDFIAGRGGRMTNTDYSPLPGPAARPALRPNSATGPAPPPVPERTERAFLPRPLAEPLPREASANLAGEGRAGQAAAAAAPKSPGRSPFGAAAAAGATGARAGVERGDPPSGRAETPPAASPRLAPTARRAPKRRASAPAGGEPPGASPAAGRRGGAQRRLERRQPKRRPRAGVGWGGRRLSLGPLDRLASGVPAERSSIAAGGPTCGSAPNDSPFPANREGGRGGASQGAEPGTLPCRPGQSALL